MKFKRIKSEEDLNLALKRVEEIWGARKGTTDGYELDFLVTIIEKYEAEKF